MSIRHLTLILAMALVCTGATAQSRKGRPRTKAKARTTKVYKAKPRVPDNYPGTGVSVYDTERLVPEDSAALFGSSVSKTDTVITGGAAIEPLVPDAEIDKDYILQCKASAPLDKVEVLDANGKVLRSQGLHKGTTASIDLNEFPKETLQFKFYGVDGNTQTIELSH